MGAATMPVSRRVPPATPAPPAAKVPPPRRARVALVAAAPLSPAIAAPVDAVPNMAAPANVAYAAAPPTAAPTAAPPTPPATSWAPIPLERFCTRADASALAWLCSAPATWSSSGSSGGTAACWIAAAVVTNGRKYSSRARSCATLNARPNSWTQSVLARTASCTWANRVRVLRRFARSPCASAPSATFFSCSSVRCTAKAASCSGVRSRASASPANRRAVGRVTPVSMREMDTPAPDPYPASWPKSAWVMGGSWASRRSRIT